MDQELSHEFSQSLQSISESSRIYVDRSLAIVTRVHFIMKEKGITQEELAIRMGKQREAVSRFLNPMYNFTLRTISEIEAALGDEVLRVTGF